MKHQASEENSIDRKHHQAIIIQFEKTHSQWTSMLDSKELNSIYCSEHIEKTHHCRIFP